MGIYSRYGTGLIWRLTIIRQTNWRFSQWRYEVVNKIMLPCSLKSYYKTNVAFLKSQTKNLPDALFRITKYLFLAIWLAEWLAMFCWVKQTALPRWLPCFVGWGKQPCQDGCHVLLGEANSPPKMAAMVCWVRQTALSRCFIIETITSPLCFVGSDATLGLKPSGFVWPNKTLGYGDCSLNHKHLTKIDLLKFSLQLPCMNLLSLLFGTSEQP